MSKSDAEIKDAWNRACSNRYGRIYDKHDPSDEQLGYAERPPLTYVENDNGEFVFQTDTDDHNGREWMSFETGRHLINVEALRANEGDDRRSRKTR